MSTWTDVRHAMRWSRRSPLTSIVVVVTTSIAMGATTTVYSVVDATLIRPLPFAGSGQVVRLSAHNEGGETQGFPLPDIEDFRRDVSSFSSVSASLPGSATLLGGAAPRQLDVPQVDSAYASVFSVRPARGRFFVQEEFQFGGPRVALLTHKLWSTEFGSDPSIVGRSITLDNEPHRVVGVLPPADFLYPSSSADALVPLRIIPGSIMERRGVMWLRAAARVVDGRSLERAGHELSQVARRQATAFPTSNAALDVRMEPLRDSVVGPTRRMLTLIAVGVSAVLLVACLNVGNLLLVRAQGRARELAVRSALGATASRLRAHLLGESLLLAVTGGFLGLLLSIPLTRILLALYPLGLPRATEVGLNLRVLLVALAAIVLSGLLSSVPMLRRVAGMDVGRDLKETERGGISHGAARVRSTLTALQVASSLVLLFASASLVTSLLRLSRVDLGFEPGGIMTFQLFAPVSRFADRSAVDEFFAGVQERLAALPGVEAVGTATQIPLNPGAFGDTFFREDRGDAGVANPRANIVTVSPGYVLAARLPVVRGRNFATTDDAATQPVVIVDEAFASTMFPGEDPVGRVIRWNGRRWEIIGLVRSTRSGTPEEPPAPTIYSPSAQVSRRLQYVLVRTNAPERLLPSIRETLRRVDATVPMTDVATMEGRLRVALAGQRFRASLMVALGFLALLLASVGIYGVVAHSVAERTRELGIRIALGDRPSRLRWRVVGRSVLVAFAGVGIGFLAWTVVGRWVSVFFYDVRASDPVILVSATMAMLGVAAAAAYGPARRVSRIDPMVALRRD